MMVGQYVTRNWGLIILRLTHYPGNRIPANNHTTILPTFVSDDLADTELHFRRSWTPWFS